MEWRCAWCGKPHEENDPPCDNCGHGEFEKAVVPAAPEYDGTEDAYGHVWVCTECGNDHPKNTPPCDRCGHSSFERQKIEYDKDEVVDEMLAESRGKSKPTADIGYLDVIDAKLAAMMFGVGLLVVVLALGFLGIVDVPFLDTGPSTEPVDAPGNDTRVGSISILDVERKYVSALNEKRVAAGQAELTRDDQLDSAASYSNKQGVVAAYENGKTPSDEGIVARIGDACSANPYVSRIQLRPTQLPDGAIAGFESEAAAARALLERRQDEFGSPADSETTDGRIGVDVHVAPDGTVYLQEVLC